MEWRKREMAEINTDNLQNLRGFILVDFEDFLYISKKKIKYKFDIINRLAFHIQNEIFDFQRH